MWTVLIIGFLVIFAIGVMAYLKIFFRQSYAKRLESEIENDLAEEFSPYNQDDPSDSEGFIEWLEDLQLEQEIIRSKDKK